MDILLFSFNGVAPICLTVFMGMLLRKCNILTLDMAKQMSKLAFAFFIPAKIFEQTYQVNLHTDINWTSLLFILLTTFLLIGALWFIVPRYIKNGAHRGEFIQGVFRGNSGVLGLPLLLNLYGESAGVAIALTLPMMVVVNNCFSPIILTHFSQNERLDAKEMAKRVLTSPFLVAAIMAVTVAGTGFKAPTFLQKTISSIGDVGSPLAMLALGAMTEVSHFKRSGKMAFAATCLRLFVIPAIVLPLAVLFGVRGMYMSAVICFFCTPTAVASHVMAKNITGDGELAGQILLQTTLLSFLTMFITIAILTSLGYM